MINKLKVLAATFLVNIAFVVSSHAAVILQVNSDGQLTGATGVTVLGELYDVKFTDGTCIDLFTGCSGPIHFMFALHTADSASRALLDVVFVGEYDTNPEKTIGIEATSIGYILTPYSAWCNTWNCTTNVHYSVALNGNSTQPDGIAGGSMPTTWDLTEDDRFVYAVWAKHVPAASTVPEPSTGALLGVAALALIWSKRRRLRRHAQ